MLTRARRIIIRCYEESLKEIKPHEDILKVVTFKLLYKTDKNNNCSFVRTVIREHLLAVGS